jgi:hypothetical protein
MHMIVLIKFISTLSLLLKIYIFFICSNDTCYFYTLNFLTQFGESHVRPELSHITFFCFFVGKTYNLTP